MNSLLPVTPNDIFEFFDAKNRELLAARAGSMLTGDEILFLMNQASMEGMRYGGQLAMSAARTVLLVQQCSASSSAAK